MHGITSLDGHSKSSGDMNKAMERMSIVFKGRLSPEQLNQIKSDIQTTAMSGMAGGMLSAAGEGGDTMMAHMSPDTIGMAQEMGILPQGQMNETTGLPAFQGDNPGQDNDPNAPDPQDAADTSGTAGPGDGPADADLGATPQEVAAMNAMANMAAVEAPMNYAALTPHERAVARDYGFDIAELATMTPAARAREIDKNVDARHANNPTAEQLDRLAKTEAGFAAANPNMAAAMSGFGTIAGLVNPAMAAVNAAKNVMSGTPGFLGDLGRGITDFGSGIASTLGELAESVPGDPDTDVQEPGGMNEEDPFVPDEDEKDTSLEENLGPDAERAKILGMGYSPADASLILDNFGTLDTFEQRFTGRFNRAPSPEMLTSPDARSFLNIQRGRPVGIGSLMT